MARHKRPSRRDFSKYENMTTEELDNILRTHFLFADGTEDKDLVLHILEVLTERDKEEINAHISDPHPSWGKFLQNHPNLAQQPTPSPSEEKVIKIPTASSPKKHSIYRSIASIAAVLICVLLIGTATAYAAGIDLFGVVAEWTADVFGFKSTAVVEQTDKIIPQQLESLYQELIRYVADPMMPTYLPEGYETKNENYYSDADMRSISFLLDNGTDPMAIDYIIHLSSDSFYMEYEKDDTPPEIIYAGTVEVFIFHNVNSYLAVWLDGDLEGSISIQSKDELIKIVESMK